MPLPLTMKYSNQQSKKQCRALSFPKTTQNLIAEPYRCLTQILCQLVDFLGKSRELQSRSSGILNWNKFAGAFGLSTIKTLKAIKETTPTHTLGMPLHDCTHPSCWLLMCGDVTKAFAALRLSMITIYKLQVSFLFTESHVLSLGLKMH